MTPIETVQAFIKRLEYGERGCGIVLGVAGCYELAEALRKVLAENSGLKIEQEIRRTNDENSPGSL